MIVATGFQGKQVAVLGLARSGLAVARALEAGGADVICWDDGAAAREKAEGLGLHVADPTRGGVMERLACLVTSPGIPHLYPAPHPVIATALAAGVPVDNDIGLFFRSFATADWAEFARMPRVVAVTGSNGKSTTAALIHRILETSGRRAQLAGNIGRGVFDLEPAEEGEVVVLELSSYQTELARALTPDVAVFTNLSPDHLDRHGGMGGYFAAKRRLFVEGGPDRAIIGVDEGEGRFLANALAQSPADDRVIRVATAPLDGAGWSVFVKKGFLIEHRKGRQVAAIDLRGLKTLPGIHNHQNACAAFAACRALGLGPREIERGLADFKGLPHRSELVAEASGVRYVNDSKATNVESAAKALHAFQSIRWICGGLQKEGGLEALHAHLGHVARAYVIGRDAERFALDLPGLDSVVCTSMAAAVEQAMDEARPGDTVLLAPAAASFDQYNDFEARGRDFTDTVRARLAARTG
ncbi:MAG: UDP-N-acetylmuramoyl-L-alanine--D-glutamate ligase [Pseudomonadota bacterium]